MSTISIKISKVIPNKKPGNNSWFSLLSYYFYGNNLCGSAAPIGHVLHNLNASAYLIPDPV